jgi:catechol 2,3-dioxygenase-like lactoylglutathione lyase family enzyme
MKISLLVLRCENIEASKGFYERLGLVFQKEKHGRGPEHYSSEHDGVVFELYPNKGVSPDDNTRLGFKVSNLQETLGKIEVSDEYEFNGTTTYVVIDPDGRKVEVN